MTDAPGFFGRFMQRFARDYLPDRSVRIPEFPETEPIRLMVRFCGQVQHVGFRLEVSAMCEKLGITGYVRNLPETDAEAQLQGRRERIDFLYAYLRSLKRLSIREIREEELPLRRGETQIRIY